MIQEKNKALVLDAFDTLFNKKDYAAAEKYWSPNYIQHSAHIPPGRDGLFNLIKASPPSLRYEHGLIMAEGDFVIVHGRYLEHRSAGELDCHRYRKNRKRASGRTLECDSGRSLARDFQERPSHVRQ